MAGAAVTASDGDAVGHWLPAARAAAVSGPVALRRPMMPAARKTKIVMPWGVVRSASVKAGTRAASVAAHQFRIIRISFLGRVRSGSHVWFIEYVFL